MPASSLHAFGAVLGVATLHCIALHCIPLSSGFRSVLFIFITILCSSRAEGRLGGQFGLYGKLATSLAGLTAKFS